MRFLAQGAVNERPGLDAVNIASPQFKANPFPFYARLRAEAPVYRTRLPTGEPAWLITRYDDAVAVLKDERFVKDRANALTAAERRRQPWFRKMFKSLQRHLLSVDGADHARLRTLVGHAFTPRLVEQMRGRIQTLTDELIEMVAWQSIRDDSAGGAASCCADSRHCRLRFNAGSPRAVQRLRRVHQSFRSRRR